MLPRARAHAGAIDAPGESLSAFCPMTGSDLLVAFTTPDLSDAHPCGAGI